MFNFFKKSPSVIPGHDPESIQINSFKSLTLHLQGLHCSSCATNIDLTLEDLPSVESKTNYAKSETKVSFNPNKTSLKDIKSAIKKLGYSIIE